MKESTEIAALLTLGGKRTPPALVSLTKVRGLIPVTGGLGWGSGSGSGREARSIYLQAIPLASL